MGGNGNNIAGVGENESNNKIKTGMEIRSWEWEVI